MTCNVDICSIMKIHELVLPWSSARASEKSLSGAWSTFSLSFFPDLHLCRAVSFTYFHSSLQLPLCNIILYFLKYVFSVCYQGHWLSQFSPPASLSWRQLKLDLPDVGEVSDIFSQKPPLKPLCQQKSCHGNPIVWTCVYVCVYHSRTTGTDWFRRNAIKKTILLYLLEGNWVVNYDCCRWCHSMFASTEADCHQFLTQTYICESANIVWMPSYVHKEKEWYITRRQFFLVWVNDEEQ